jgi:DNA-damage-inducible protein J
LRIPILLKLYFSVIYGLLQRSEKAALSWTCHKRLRYNVYSLLSGVFVMTTTTMIHVRLEDSLKKEAAMALEAMGLSLSDAIRVFLTRVAADQKFPFALQVPNAETRKAMEEARVITKARFENQQGLLDALERE